MSLFVALDAISDAGETATAALLNNEVKRFLMLCVEAADSTHTLSPSPLIDAR
jgi:hypothetical protein